MREDNQSLSHTTWNCKYHIVFAPKYRRQIIYGRYKASIGRIIRDLCERKGVIIHEANACSDLKYKYGNRKFWCRGYYVDTVGRNQKVIAEYIQNQLQEDRVADQLTLFESVDPFTGEINKRK
ncbi:IS200 family transposase [Streptococcus pneumoniae]|nr:IS200 family transposase [Streptococcus pneumoniae]